jgi:hypothetical protein
MHRLLKRHAFALLVPRQIVTLIAARQTFVVAYSTAVV